MTFFSSFGSRQKEKIVPKYVYVGVQGDEYGKPYKFEDSAMRCGFHENSKIETFTKLHSIDQLTSSCENKNI